jgi:protein-S-isoprenylcysteine O-methyltransferase Ste14
MRADQRAGFPHQLRPDAGAEGAISRLPKLGPRGEGWVIIQAAFLAAIFTAGVLTGPDWPQGHSTALQAIGGVLVVVGVIVGVLGLRALRGAMTGPLLAERASHLVEDGMYALMRHPIYAGQILITLGWSLLRSSFATLLLSLMYAVFLDLKGRREETVLSERFSQYADYARRVRRFLPGVY